MERVGLCSRVLTCRRGGVHTNLLLLKPFPKGKCGLSSQITRWRSLCRARICAALTHSLVICQQIQKLLGARRKNEMQRCWHFIWAMTTAPTPHFDTMSAQQRVIGCVNNKGLGWAIWVTFGWIFVSLKSNFLNVLNKQRSDIGRRFLRYAMGSRSHAATYVQLLSHLLKRSNPIQSYNIG